MQHLARFHHPLMCGLLTACFVSSNALAQADDPRELVLLARGASSVSDLRFASEPKELGLFSTLNNSIFKPPGGADGPLPALVLAHTCGGIRIAESKYWLNAALAEGYVVLVVDSLRGNKTNCLSPSPVPYGRLVKDLYDAAGHLAKLPLVDPARMAVLGFSQGAFSAGAVASPAVKAAVAPQATRFAASVGLYGTCQWPAGTFRNVDYPLRFVFPDTDRPLLYLMANDDTETPPAYCDSVLPALQEKNAPVEWYVYEHATHCWDCSTLNGLTKTSVTGSRVVYRYDAQITEDARRRVFTFLRDKLHR